MNKTDNQKHLDKMVNTDLGKFVELYARFGIDCKVNQRSKEEQFLGYEITMTPEKHADSRVDTTNAKIDGYGGYYVRHLFDQNGKFIQMGIWE